MEKNWREAITRTLREEARALHYTEIAELVLSKNYYKTDGATPAATVNAHISSSIKNDGEQSPFLRVDRGTFTLRQSTINAHSSTIPTASTPTEAVDEEPSTSIIRAFGMYWQRELVIWKSEPIIYGQAQINAKSVDFGGQQGIYILYDHHRVIYAGRTTDRSLGRRLFEHTRDRLSGRWNRFSWFGLLDVSETGTLNEVPLKASLGNLTATLEAILIEALEPPLNRRRGDDLAAVEYFQAVDPELREREIQNTLRSVEERLRGRT
ncbi:MAG: HTH domain-containing protein [Pseudomonadota bacterium]